MQSGIVAGQLQESLHGQSNPLLSTLNFDIFHQIMANAAHKSTVLSCMKTCRALHRFGVPILLRFPVTISYNRLASFCTFMLAKHPPRMQWLRQLCLAVYWSGYPPIEEKENIFDLLAQVLENAEGLEDLRILGMKEVLDLSPRLSDTLCNLTSLRNLAVLDFNQECSLILSRMDIPKMRKLCLQFYYSYNLSYSLKPFQEHLEELHICGPAEFYSFSPTMPRVTKFTLEDIDLSNILVPPLLTSFPNLKSFSLVTDRGSKLGADFWQSHHLLNQSQYHDGDWDQLSHVRGTALSLYVLGLNSSVEHLELVRFDEGSLPFLSTLLHDLRPTVLSLEMNTRRGFSLSSLASSDSFTFSKEILPPHVNLNFHISKESGAQNKIIVGPTY